MICDNECEMIFVKEVKKNYVCTTITSRMVYNNDYYDVKAAKNRIRTVE